MEFKLKFFAKVIPLSCASILAVLSIECATAATMETVVEGIVSNQSGPDHNDQDGLGLFPTLENASGAFTGVGKAFSFSFVWDSNISAAYYYDQPATPGVPAVSGISTDANAPSNVIKSASITVDGQTISFGGSPSFFTINQYAHDSSQEYLMRLDNIFDPGSSIYFKGAGINTLPASIFGSFSSSSITKGFPSYGYLSFLENGLKTEFGLDIAMITVSLLNGTGGGGSTGGEGGGGIVISEPGTGGGSGADVPIPAALPLLASAVAGVTVMGRRRRKGTKA